MCTPYKVDLTLSNFFVDRKLRSHNIKPFITLISRQGHNTLKCIHGFCRNFKIYVVSSEIDIKFLYVTDNTRFRRENLFLIVETFL